MVRLPDKPRAIGRPRGAARSGVTVRPALHPQLAGLLLAPAAPLQTTRPSPEGAW